MSNHPGVECSDTSQGWEAKNVFALENWLGGGSIGMEFIIAATVCVPSEWHPGYGIVLTNTHTKVCVYVSTAFHSAAGGLAGFYS